MFACLFVLARLLHQCVEWRPLLLRQLEAGLRAGCSGDADPDRSSLLACLPALCVLGGYIERLRAGGAAKVCRVGDREPHGNGVVVSYSPSLGSVEVALPIPSAEVDASATGDDVDVAGEDDGGAGSRIVNVNASQVRGGEAVRGRQALSRSCGMRDCSASSCPLLPLTMILRARLCCVVQVWPVSATAVPLDVVPQSVLSLVADLAVHIGLAAPMKLPRRSKAEAAAQLAACVFSPELSSSTITFNGDLSCVTSTHPSNSRAVVDCPMSVRAPVSGRLSLRCVELRRRENVPL